MWFTIVGRFAIAELVANDLVSIGSFWQHGDVPFDYYSFGSDLIQPVYTSVYCWTPLFMNMWSAKFNIFVLQIRKKDIDDRMSRHVKAFLQCDQMVE